MTMNDIFHQAAQAADSATQAKFGSNGQYPSSASSTGDYWKLVYEATVAALLKHNGSY